MTNYQLQDDINLSKAPQTKDGYEDPETGTVNTMPAYCGEPWLFAWLCVSTAITVLITLVVLMILPLAPVALGGGSGRVSSLTLLLCLSVLLGVPILLIWATVLMWRAYRHEQKYQKSLWLSIPAILVVLVIAIIFIINMHSTQQNKGFTR